jgi:sugar/nucleoside kinase (ribokinase family)
MIPSMNTNHTYDILFIGNYTKDTIISPTGTRYVDGGAVNYAAHAAARLGLHSAVITRLAQEDQRVVDKFRSAGIDCFATYTPASTCMQLEYPTTDPDIRTLSVACTAGTITAHEIEPFHAQAAVIGTSLRGEVDDAVLDALKQKGIFLAADMQGFVRVLRGQSLNYEPWQEMQAALANIDVVKSDAVEAEFLTGEKDIRKAAQIFADMGPKEIVLTHKDGVLIYAGQQYYEAGFFPEKLNGRSGRGDTCIGSYMSMRLSKPPVEAGIWAAAVTSLKMEALGPFDRSVDEVQAFIQRHYR